MNTAGKWEIAFLNEVVLEEFMDIPLDMQAYFHRVCELIGRYGLENLGRPHIAPLKNKLWEIRMKGKDGIARAIYITQKDKIITILRVFKKKTKKVPNEEIALALRRLREA
ncbi:MAG: type II toxin-antitoxin system RelE/ParE family toxin [Desulfarculus sp.]|nr:type II toxin-antitoxin system RelE/ParE family toxin [Desulfarculus sp.]